MQYQIINSDSLEYLRSLQDNVFDSIVTDPPYGLHFMGKKWDYDIPSVEIWRECLRVLKPGGHLLSFAGTRTQHRMIVNIEEAGFQIRDMIAWVYGSGFPKSHNLKDVWQGWGTALKPALEPITLARKPFTGTIAENVQTHGTGAINIDGCRAENCAKSFTDNRTEKKNDVYGKFNPADYDASKGRWPANLIHDGSEEVAGLFGPTTRFFYCAKASKNDRDEGLEGCEEVSAGIRTGRKDHSAGINGYAGASGSAKNFHPTVKPTALMRYLCRLVTPPGGTILDPFMGSGSTGKAAKIEGFNFVGVEKEKEYCEIAERRIKGV